MEYSKFYSSAVPDADNYTILNDLKAILNSGRPAPYKMLFGNPSSNIFPFFKAKVTLENDETFDIDPELMKTLQQYHRNAGYDPLNQHIRALTKQIHDPPQWEDRSVVMLNGSLNALDIIFKMLLNEKDSVFVPMESYHGIFVVGKHLLANYVSVKTDDGGILPESLREALIKCKESKGIPKFLYVNPGGSNPTGTVLNESRRRRIYEICCQYDLLIVEDDPYYFLQFCDTPPSSFLRLDTEGRVIRLESFSKLLGAGLRVGYAIIPNPMVQVLVSMVYGMMIHASTLPQVMVSRLFDTWGIDGFLKKAKEIREFYKKQRDLVLQASEKHLKGLCEWTAPAGGFFLWLKVLGIKDTQNLLLECAKKRGVVVVPGCAFQADMDKPSQYMRICYSLITEEEAEKAFSNLADAIREKTKSK